MIQAEAIELFREREQCAREFRLPSLRKRPQATGIVTDPAETTKHEDGMWAQDDEVQVSVVDTSCIDPQSALAKYAKLLGQTRYFPWGPIPMFPRHIGQLLNLTESREMPAITTTVTLDEETCVATNTSVAQTRLTSRQIPLEALFSEQHLDAEILPVVRRLGHVARVRSTEEQLLPHHVVREAMRIAAEGIGAFMLGAKIPGIFWCERHLTTLPYLNQNRISAPFTSPLRRMADFVNQANVVAYLEGRTFPFEGASLERITSYSNSAREVTMLRNRYEPIDKVFADTQALEFFTMRNFDLERFSAQAARYGQMPHALTEALVARLGINDYPVGAIATLLATQKSSESMYVGQQAIIAHLRQDPKKVDDIFDRMERMEMVQDTQRTIVTRRPYQVTLSVRTLAGNTCHATGINDKKRPANQLAKINLLAAMSESCRNEPPGTIELRDSAPGAIRVR